MFRSPATGVVLFVLHAVFAPVSQADNAPHMLPDGTIVHGDWGLYRPGWMPLRFEGPYDNFYYAPHMTPTVRRYYTTGHFYPTNKEDPAAYQRRANENGPTQPAQPYHRFYGAQSEEPGKDYSDPTIYPKYDVPADVYVAPQQGPHVIPRPRPHPRP